MSTKLEKTEEQLALESRKVKALEKIANSLDALTVWFEEIDKEEWSDRIQYYLSEFHSIRPSYDLILINIMSIKNFTEYYTDQRSLYKLEN
jgi:hypothetical protein